MPAVPWPRDKMELAKLGTERVVEFCEHNGLFIPEMVAIARHDWHVNACAYYRAAERPPIGRVKICLDHCQWPCGEANSRNWTWPGSTIDREPFGVLAHELGHHADYLTSPSKGLYFGDYSASLCKKSGEKPISGYCPNSAEWFAEMFRLFVTNAALLKLVRPKTYALLCEKFKPVSHRNWLVELGDNVPQRVIDSQVRKFSK